MTCPKCKRPVHAGVIVCACGRNLADDLREYARLRTPSIHWDQQRGVIPFAPFQALTKSARRALAKLWHGQ